MILSESFKSGYNIFYKMLVIYYETCRSETNFLIVKIKFLPIQIKIFRNGPYSVFHNTYLSNIIFYSEQQDVFCKSTTQRWIESLPGAFSHPGLFRDQFLEVEIFTFSEKIITLICAVFCSLF